jgi:hypothetical protein
MSSKPPNIRIRGLNRGQGIPRGYLLGRVGAGVGPVELVKSSQAGRLGLATKSFVIANAAASSTTTAVAVVQKAVNAHNVTDGSAATLHLTSTPTAGNLLVFSALLFDGNGAPSTPTGLTQDTSIDNGVYYQVLLYRYVLAGDGKDWQIDNNTRGFWSGAVWELSGVRGIWAQDHVATHVGLAGAFPSSSGSITGFNTAAANELLLGFWGGNCGSGGMASTITQSPIATDDGQFNGTDGALCYAHANHVSLVPALATAVTASVAITQSADISYVYVEMASSAGGTAGPAGPAGTPGAMGPPGRDGDDGEDGQQGPRGRAGVDGANGAQGNPGLMMLAMDGEEGPEGMPIPGPKGTAGTNGTNGAAGAIGPRGAPGFDGQDGEEGYGYQPLSGYVPLSGGVLTGPLTTIQGSQSAPAINIGGNANAAGFYTDGSNLFGSIDGSFNTQWELLLRGFSLQASGAQVVYTGQRTDATITAASAISSYQGQAFNSTGATLITWAQTRYNARVPTTGSEQGEISFFTFHGGALTADFTINSGNLYSGAFSAPNLLIDNLQNFYGQPAHSYSRQKPTTGFSITIGAGVASLILDPTGTLATGTIIMPAAPVDGQEIGIASNQIITSLTVNANTGQTISGTFTLATLAANGFARWKYVLADTNWYRVG